MGGRPGGRPPALERAARGGRPLALKTAAPAADDRGDEPARHPRAHRADRPDRRARSLPRPPRGLRLGFLTALNDGIQRGSSLAAPAGGARACRAPAARGAWPPPRARSASPSSRPAPTTAPRSPQYRTATAGSGVGPWCAYFTSWAAAQAGVPLGEAGQGFGSVSALYAWAPAHRPRHARRPRRAPQPGRPHRVGRRHIGIVESVDPDGSIHTIEGNSSNAVSRRTYGPDGGGATGYVRLAESADARARAVG